jgi:hypothetical protein
VELVENRELVLCIEIVMFVEVVEVSVSAVEVELEEVMVEEAGYPFHQVR